MVSLNRQRKYPQYVYGHVTNIREWRFCCYIKPVGDKSVSAENFIVSSPMMTRLVNPEIFLPTKEFVEQIAKIIRGFVVKDVDEIVRTMIKI